MAWMMNITKTKEINHNYLNRRARINERRTEWYEQTIALRVYGAHVGCGNRPYWAEAVEKKETQQNHGGETDDDEENSHRNARAVRVHHTGSV